MKNQLEKETQLYNEITSKIPETYLLKYKRFMKHYPLNSTYAGCLEFLGSEEASILKMKDEIEEIRNENENFNNEYKVCDEDLEKAEFY